jgi:E3 ubiquitin-protein ligase NEDD4
LQGNDGNIKKFTIHGVDRETSVFPRSHTCFNRIDLPNYTSRKELHDKLKTAVTMCAVGFDME